MRKILTSKLILVAILFISFSCTKKNDGLVIPDCKVVSFKSANVSSGGSTNSSGTITYRGDGQVESILYSNRSKSTYTYAGNIVTVLNIDATSKTVSSRVFTIGSNGHVSKYVYTVYNNGLPSSTTATYLYEYNFFSYLTKANYSSSSGFTSEETYTYSEGNLISYKDTYKGRIDLYEYEYYTDKENNGTQNVGVKFGRNNKNLVKKMVSSILVANSRPRVYYTSNYNYTLDAKNNVTQEIDNTIYAVSNYSSIYTYDYVYECK